MLQGAWIVSEAWAEQCIQVDGLVPEQPFEIAGTENLDAPTDSATRARMNAWALVGSTLAFV